MLNEIDPNIVCDGVKRVNDTASAGFIAMLEELYEFSKKGTNVKKEKGAKKHGNHREKQLYAMNMPGFFAAGPVRRNDYINDEKAMGAYWKEWKNQEKGGCGNGALLRSGAT